MGEKEHFKRHPRLRVAAPNPALWREQRMGADLRAPACGDNNLGGIHVYIKR